MLRPLKRSGNKTLEPIVPDIIHMIPKMIKPIIKRHVSVLVMGLPVSGAMALGSIAVDVWVAILTVLPSKMLPAQSAQWGGVKGVETPPLNERDLGYAHRELLEVYLLNSK